MTSITGSIELSHVTFRYDKEGHKILDDLSLTIPARQYVAIVGKTGCGKSTLLRLLLGFEKPEKGAIFYDRKDIQSLDIGSLRKCIGTVMQDGELFGGSIFENITISAPQLLLLDEATSALDNITQKQVSEALDAMRCTRVVIAHRLSTIRHCDRILVMDGGKIVEDGKYKELIEKKGIFADLVARQQLTPTT